MKDVTFGVIVGTRGFFNPLLASEGRKEIMALLDKMGYKYVIVSENDTKYGVIETTEDAKKCARLFRDNYEKIDGIIVSLPNFGDEIGVVQAIDFAKLNVPVLVHASDDDLDKMDVSHRRDSFCGKLSVCNNLYQYNIKFTNTTFHTCPIKSKEFEADVEYFAQVCKVVKGIRNARIAQIGTRPAPFQTVRYSEKLLQNSGITVIPIDLSVVIAMANKISDTSLEIKNKVEEVKKYGNIPKDIAEDKIIKSSKLNLAIEKFIQENECIAGAAQCWDSIQNNYGCAMCLPMSMLGEKGIPMACETDVTGALSMYAMYLASGSPSGYLDWNNNYSDKRDMCINFHCSNFPGSFMGRDMEISNLDILGNSLGYDKCFGACKGQVSAGSMTFAKISTDDVWGTIKVYFGEGEFTNDKINSCGGIAVCKVPNLQTLLDFICKNGFEHHVAMNRSNCAKVLNEAFENYLGWEVYWHK
ncbi:MAG: fucose isomerase [Actinobacteria bacterium]|nr:fucose isomerase [Actinomycetota bacterium]